MSSHPHSASVFPLLAVRRLHDAVHAGLGATRIAIRTLDDVTFHVAAGELVIVRGDDASGATALLRALSGRMRVAEGARDVAPGVAVRRASIDLFAMQCIADAWAAPRRIDRAHSLAATRPSVTPARRVLYLLRVARRASIRTADVPPAAARRSWQSWVNAVRMSGGGAVIQSVESRAPVASAPHAVHERRIDVNAMRPSATDAHTVRVVRMQAGRIVHDAYIERLLTADPTSP